MLSFAKDLQMEKQTNSIRLRQVEAGFEALVPQLNVSATGATIDDAVNNVIREVSRVMEAKARAEMTQKRRKKTVA
jgi:hypothetical protein